MIREHASKLFMLQWESFVGKDYKKTLATHKIAGLSSLKLSYLQNHCFITELKNMAYLI